MAQAAEVPSCTSCGVCCFSDDARYLRVARVDSERLGDAADELTVRLEGRVYMRLVDGHCSALIYEEQSGRFLCSIYERRPDVCRWLEPGSGTCQQDRRDKAGRTLVLLRRSAQG